MEGGDSTFEKFTVPTLKAFLKARIQSVPGNKRERVARAVGFRNTHSSHVLAIFWSAGKRCKDNIAQILCHLPAVFLANVTVLTLFLYYFAILGSTSIVIHSVNQLTPTQTSSRK